MTDFRIFCGFDPIAYRQAKRIALKHKTWEKNRHGKQENRSLSRPRFFLDLKQTAEPNPPDRCTRPNADSVNDGNNTSTNTAIPKNFSNPADDIADIAAARTSTLE